MDVKDRTYDGGAVETDGTNFTGCTFNGAELHYSGGEHPLFDSCAFNGNVSWIFDGPALRTIQLLQRIANGDGGEAFIADMFAKGMYYAD